MNFGRWLGLTFELFLLCCSRDKERPHKPTTSGIYPREVKVPVNEIDEYSSLPVPTNIEFMIYDSTPTLTLNCMWASTSIHVCTCAYIYVYVYGYTNVGMLELSYVELNDYHIIMPLVESYGYLTSMLPPSIDLSKKIFVDRKTNSIHRYAVDMETLCSQR